jgi:GTP-binding protein YchF
VSGNVDPLRDVDVVSIELALADLETTEKAISKMEKMVKTDPRHEGKDTLDALARIRDGLREGRAAREVMLTAEEKELLKSYNLLTMKPTLYVANVDEADLGKEPQTLKAIRGAVGEESVIGISVKIEEEISELPEDEQGAFLADLGLSESGVESVILAGYRLLNLITFYTIANDKLRAWQVVRGTKAPQAAGKIHSDMERGFIRAEVVSYQDLEKHKTMAQLHHHGLVRVEGKDYEIRPDDVVHFLFSV